MSAFYPKRDDTTLWLSYNNVKWLKMRVHASVFAQESQDWKSGLSKLELLNVFYIHLDVTDANLMIAKDVLAYLKEDSRFTVEIHAVLTNPDDLWPILSDCPISCIYFQVEDLASDPFTNIPSSYQEIKKGLAYRWNSLEDLQPEKWKSLDALLIMTTIPGQSGGSFPNEAFQVIGHWRRALAKTVILIDGGIRPEVASVLKILGVSNVVVGAHLMRSDNPYKAYLDLLHPDMKVDVQAKYFMIDAKNVAQVPSNCTVWEALDLLDRGGLGILMVVDQGKCLGMATNADLRRAVLQEKEGDTPTRWWNNNPLSIQSETTFSQMIDLLNLYAMPLHLLPVIDEDQFSGLVHFNYLAHSL